MSEDLSLIVATPRVVETKASINSDRHIRVKATEHPKGGALSVHYETEEPPVVLEQVLVAVLQGVYPQWLEDLKPGGDTGDITYEADSANKNGRAMRVESIPIGDASRLMLTTWSRLEQGGALRELMLTKGQVTSLIEMLLAVYPRLHED